VVGSLGQLEFDEQERYGDGASYNMGACNLAGLTNDANAANRLQHLVEVNCLLVTPTRLVTSTV
jgi:hypothetical protein